MKLVGVRAVLGKPRDQSIDGGALVTNSSQQTVMLDCQRIESWVAGFIEIESTRTDQTVATPHEPRAEQGEGNRLAPDRTAQQAWPARFGQDGKQRPDPIPRGEEGRVSGSLEASPLAFENGERRQRLPSELDRASQPGSAVWHISPRTGFVA